MDAAARGELNEHLRRLQGGDRAAARFVFDALWQPCLGLARGLLRGSGQRDDDAKDAAQAALVKLFEQAPSFDATRSGLGWALALVTWECRTTRKKRARSRELPGEAVVVDNAPSPATHDPLDRLVRAADVARVVDGFVALTEHDQATLRALLDGDKAGDPALRKRRQRAIDRLRALVLGPAEQLKPELPLLQQRGAGGPGEPHV